MGLDQYILNDDSEVIMTMRKNYVIDDFFSKKHYMLSSEIFNCVNIEITKDYYEDLKKSILTFFLEEGNEEDQDFCKKNFEEHIVLLRVIESELNLGKKVFYTNWW